MTEIVNGKEVMDGWGARLAASQEQTALRVNGVDRGRIKYGEEIWPDGDKWEPPGVCHDCCAMLGQYHVQGCDIERCPACGGQLLSCSCENDGPKVDPMAVFDKP